MANLAILWKKPTDTGTYSGGSWVAGLPLANLTTQDVKQVARSTDTTTANTQFRIDCGNTPLLPFSMFVLLGHNATTAAQWQIVASNNADASDPVYDSGMVNIWPPTTTFGSLPWGSFPWDGVDEAAYPAGPVAFLLTPTPNYARYIFVYLDDHTNPAGYLQVGRFLAGQAWSPTINMQYGAGIQTVDPGVPRRTLGGRKLVRAIARYRTVALTLSSQTEDDAMGVSFEIDRQLGKAGDFFFVYDSDDDPTILFKRALYCSLVDTSEITEDAFQRYGWKISAEELV